MLSCEFCEISKNTFSCWLPLSFQIFYWCMLLWSLEIHRFRKILNIDKNWTIPILQVFVHVFETHIIRKILPRYMDPVTSAGWEKNSLATCFYLFSKLKLLLWHQCQVTIAKKIWVVVPNIFLCISGRRSWGLNINADPYELWCIITEFQISCNP